MTLADRGGEYYAIYTSPPTSRQHKWTSILDLISPISEIELFSPILNHSDNGQNIDF
jgi:hypothetical protein